MPTYLAAIPEDVSRMVWGNVLTHAIQDIPDHTQRFYSNHKAGYDTKVSQLRVDRIKPVGRVAMRTAPDMVLDNQARYTKDIIDFSIKSTVKDINIAILNGDTTTQLENRLKVRCAEYHRATGHQYQI